MYSSQKVSDKIKATAKSQNIAIGKMLSDCDLSKNTLSSMQSGGYLPRTETLAKIADYLNCSVDYLLGRTDDTATVNNAPSPVYIIGESGDREVRHSSSSKDRDALLADLGIHKTGYIMSKDNKKTELTDSEYTFLMNSLELFRQK